MNKSDHVFSRMPHDPFPSLNPSQETCILLRLRFFGRPFSLSFFFLVLSSRRSLLFLRLMANPFPTKTIITSGTPTPQTRQTDAPSSSCPPNAVIVKISTVLSIPNYKQFYAQPIDYFTPAYDVRQDGSLLTAPFKEDLLESNLALLVLSALALLFLRNIIVSGDYLRRGSGKFKKKKLFHALFFSQILAIGAFVPLLLSYFTPVGNCTL